MVNIYRLSTAGADCQTYDKSSPGKYRQTLNEKGKGTFYNW